MPVSAFVDQHFVLINDKLMHKKTLFLIDFLFFKKVAEFFHISQQNNASSLIIDNSFVIF